MVFLVALLGVLWHASLLMMNDGFRRGQYDARVFAIQGLPEDEQSLARERLVAWTRRRITPFGRAFSIAWRKHRPGRGAKGRAWNANQRVNRLGTMESQAGSVLLLLLLAWVGLGATTVRCHVSCLVGGTAGGVLLGATCLWASLLLTAFTRVALTGVAHVLGAGGGALGLVGIANWAQKL